MISREMTLGDRTVAVMIANMHRELSKAAIYRPFKGFGAVQGVRTGINRRTCKHGLIDMSKNQELSTRSMQTKLHKCHVSFPRAGASSGPERAFLVLTSS